MTCEKARDAFPELLDPRTPATAQLEARSHLATCPDCQRDFAALTQTAAALDAMPIPPPSPRLRRNFYAMLEEEKHSAASVRVIARREHRASLWRWILSPLAAAALIAVGFSLGRRYAPTPAPAPAPVASTDDATSRKLAQLEKKMGQMTQLMAVSLMQQQQSPANERLREVLAAANKPNPSSRVLDDLVQALNFDPSTNVRLRAIEALYPHAGRELVRAGVLAALPREQNPLVQLELIDFVATAQDRNAAPALERISADQSTDTSVRDAARLALAQL